MMRQWIILSVLMSFWAATALGAVFQHNVHNEITEEAGFTCDACHKEDAKTLFPPTKVCLECHDQSFVDSVSFPGTKTHGPTWALNHRPAAKGNTYDCSACHQQDFCLECHKSGFADEQGSFSNNMINVHRSDFHVSHPIAARTDPQLCSSCHESRFCSDCHDEFRLGRASGPSHLRVFDLGLNGDIDAIHQGIDSTFCDSCHLQGSVAPSFHDWSVGHAREARRNLPVCQSCHPEGDVCLKCHSAKGGAGRFNPHGDDWGDRKGRLNDASNGKTCKKCH